jgi:hypothetical protein
MSNTKKIVRINESDLVNVLDKIVNEAVQIKKKEWIAEQAKTDKTAILESKLAKLEARISKLDK